MELFVVENINIGPFIIKKPKNGFLSFGVSALTLTFNNSVDQCYIFDVFSTYQTVPSSIFDLSFGSQKKYKKKRSKITMFSILVSSKR